MKKKVLLLAVCISSLICFFPLKSYCQDSKMLEQWGFASLVYGCGYTEWDMDRKITKMDCAAIDFLLKSPPKMSYVTDKNVKYFKFDSPMPKAKTRAKIVFVTPEAKYCQNCQVSIPKFKPIIKGSKGSATSLNVKEFKDYTGNYEFTLDLNMPSLGNIVVAGIDCFNEGSEHHIFGKIELFGVKFNNDSNEPLIFKISNGKYTYIKGKGTAITVEGSTIEFGK